LRGRAGRQGDPGSSQFFVSLQDPLLIKYADEPGTQLSACDHLQRGAEGQALGCRLFLRKYETLVEGQRQQIADRRQRVLTAHIGAVAERGEPPSASELERLVTLDTIDDLWSDYLAVVSELRASTIWVSLGGGNPFREYLHTVHAMFQELTHTIDEEIAARLERATTHGIEPRQRGTTWTYVTTDEPFGTMTERLMRRLAVTLHLRRS
jgi:preprotein translocase subunit SecA